LTKYEKEHLPDAFVAFKAKRAWRSWSKNDPSVHWAFYEFASVEDAAQVAASEAIASLSKEFDRAWGRRVLRTRDVIEVVQHLPHSTDYPPTI
jgi:hypothetical protein